MSNNKQAMRTAGRKIRRAFDNYIAELEAAAESGVLMACDRVITETLPDGTVSLMSDPDPITFNFVNAGYLKDLRFTFRITETLEESELEDDVETPPAA
jgi:hypothetical protein